jgi:CMP-N-acetylneuraminic acid synthetase
MVEDQSYLLKTLHIQHNSSLIDYHVCVHAILPIKAHSERVPGKNFKLLGGKPLYTWIIEALLEIPTISGITIDTDSNDAGLWKLGRNSKINIKQRREELIGDFVSMNEIIWDFVKSSDEDSFLMTHVTNPFLSKYTIETAIKEFYSKKNQGYDSLFSVSPIQGRLFNSIAEPINHNPRILMRTQDLEPIYLENSCLYIFDKESFAVKQARIGVKPILFTTPLIDSIDIDTQEEWNLAEHIAKGFLYN